MHVKLYAWAIPWEVRILIFGILQQKTTLTSLIYPYSVRLQKSVFVPRRDFFDVHHVKSERVSAIGGG